MDKRSFSLRFGSAAVGVAYVALGALSVPALGLACMLFIEEVSTADASYVSDDAALGGVLYCVIFAIVYGVFVAPALWRRRPWQDAGTERARTAPAYDDNFPSGSAGTGFVADQQPWWNQGTPGPFWENRASAPEPIRPFPPHRIIPVTDDPTIELGPTEEVDAAEIAAFEKAAEAAVRPPVNKFDEVGVPTLVGIPVMKPVPPDDVVDDDAWFT